MIAISCPFCGDTASIIRRGYNRCGTQRLLCKVCQKRFTPDPVNRSLSEEKRELIENALAERMSQRGIARTFKVSRDTIRALRKKSPNGS
jgi:transposase-like protein